MDKNITLSYIGGRWPRWLFFFFLKFEFFRNMTYLIGEGRAVEIFLHAQTNTPHNAPSPKILFILVSCDLGTCRLQLKSLDYGSVWCVSWKGGLTWGRYGEQKKSLAPEYSPLSSMASWRHLLSWWLWPVWGRPRRLQGEVFFHMGLSGLCNNCPEELHWAFEWLGWDELSILWLLGILSILWLTLILDHLWVVQVGWRH